MANRLRLAAVSVAVAAGLVVGVIAAIESGLVPIYGLERTSHSTFPTGRGALSVEKPTVGETHSPESRQRTRENRVVSGGAVDAEHLALDLVDRAPPIFVDDSSYAFNHVFRVRNATHRTVQIRETTCGECGCRRSELATDVLLPGEETTFEVSTNFGPTPGVHTIACTLLTDFEEHPKWLYRVDVPVYPRFQFQPGTLAFGSVDPGETAERSLQLETYALPGQQHFVFAGFQSEHMSVTVAGSPLEAILPTGVIRRAVPIKASLNAGELFGAQRDLIPLDSGESIGAGRGLWATPHAVARSSEPLRGETTRRLVVCS